MEVPQIQRLPLANFGESAKTLTASLKLGLHELVATIRLQPSTSDYHIKGFARLKRLHQEIRDSLCCGVLCESGSSVSAVGG